jgi:hypothetical protein
MKSLPVQVTTQQAAEQSRPVNLFILNFETPLYFAAAKANVAFPATGGNTYVAKAINYDPLSQDYSGNIIRLNVRFDNSGQDMAAYAAALDFLGVWLTIKKVWRDALTNAIYHDEIFHGVIEGYSFDYNWMTINARNGDALTSRCPSRLYQRKCPWAFGGAECNRNGNADITTAPLKVTGTAESGTTSTLTDSALTQATFFWNWGKLTCTKDGVTESRIVKTFSSLTDTVTVIIPFSFTIDATTTYTLVAGCDKTWDTCRKQNAWGPTADNRLNYGGCRNVGSIPLSIKEGYTIYQTPIPYPYEDAESARRRFDLAENNYLNW